MNLLRRLLSVLPLLLVALMLLPACVSTGVRPGDNAYVYVAENGILTFHGEVVTPYDLPKELKRAGVTPQNPIRIVSQGEVPERMLMSIAGGLGRNGFRRVLIIGGEKHAAVIVE